MNPRPLALTLTLLSGLCCLAQQGRSAPATAAKPAPEAPPKPAPEAPPKPDPVVADAIKKFFAARATTPRPNEVTVELPPPPPQPAADSPTPAPKDPASAEPSPAKDAASPAPTVPDTPAAAEPEPSLTVQVEKLQTGTGAIDPKTVKLLAPFPAKPLAAIPPGWRLDSSTGAPPFIRNVELAPGTSITLTIRPHLLVPDAASFTIAEPGFDPALGYRQAQTVSAILANSLEQLDEDAKQLGNAIDHLQQLVSSLPHPAPKPQPPPTLNPSSKR